MDLDVGSIVKCDGGKERKREKNQRLYTGQIKSDIHTCGAYCPA